MKVHIICATPVIDGKYRAVIDVYEDGVHMEQMWRHGFETEGLAQQQVDEVVKAVRDAYGVAAEQLTVAEGNARENVQ